jgi:hypothetical protein
MKRITIVGLFMLFLILASFVYAEPAKGESWVQHIVRVNNMSDRIDNIYFDGDKWEDRYAAAFATHGWLFISYSHILYYADKGTISLTQQEKAKYTLLRDYHKIRMDEFSNNIRYFSGATGEWVLDRYLYWMKILDNGGIINFK